MLPNGKEPPVIPPGVDPIEPSERSLPPEDPDDGNPRAISTIPLCKANQHMLHQDASSLWTSKRPKQLQTLEYKVNKALLCNSTNLIPTLEFSTAESQQVAKQFAASSYLLPSAS
jgi:hypothetical protein